MNVNNNETEIPEDQLEEYALKLSAKDVACRSKAKAKPVSDSAILGEYIENFDKPEGLSAVMDKKHESDEYVCGKWASEKGESSIFQGQQHELPLLRGTCG